MAGPVGLDQGDSALAQALLDVGAVEDYALVDLAAEAPAGGEVNQDGPALGLIFFDYVGG